MLGWEMQHHLEEHYKKGKINQLVSVTSAYCLGNVSLTSCDLLAFNDLHSKHQGLPRHVEPNILNHPHI